MWIDIAFLVFLILGFAIGYKKGIIYSIFGLLSFIIGIAIAVKFSYNLSVYMHEWFDISSRYLPLIAFILLFVIVVLVFKGASYLVEKFAETLYLGTVNRILGGILWCFILTLVFSTVLWFLSEIQFITSDDKTGSRTYDYVQPIAPILFSAISNLIPFFEGIFESLENLIRDLGNSNKTLSA